MLRKTIHKPIVFASENPALTFGFVMLIGIFEKLPPEFYDNLMHDADQLSNMFLILQIYQSLTTPIPLLDEALEIQRTDITITQYWLQAALWKIFMSARSKDSSSSPSISSSSPTPLGAAAAADASSWELLPWHAPVSAGKSILSFMSGVSQKSADAHGIGMVSRPPMTFPRLFVNEKVKGTKTVRCRHLHRASGTKRPTTSSESSSLLNSRPERAVMGCTNKIIAYPAMQILFISCSANAEQRGVRTREYSTKHSR
jgi:hypothetical protein